MNERQLSISCFVKTLLISYSTKTIIYNAEFLSQTFRHMFNLPIDA